jgi:hypothetical protein
MPVYSNALAPTAIAKAIARPPTIVRPGYLRSRRRPSLKSSPDTSMIGLRAPAMHYEFARISLTNE